MRATAIALLLVSGCLDNCVLGRRGPPVSTPATPVETQDPETDLSTDADTDTDADADTDPMTDTEDEARDPTRVHVLVCPLVEWFEYVGDPPASGVLSVGYTDENGVERTATETVPWLERVGDGYQHQQAFDCLRIINLPAPTNEDDLSSFTFGPVTFTFEDSRGEVIVGPYAGGAVYDPPVPPAQPGDYQVDVAFGLYNNVVEGSDPASLIIAPPAP